MNRSLLFAIGAVAVLLFIGVSSVFIVDERQQAVKLQFGQVVGDRDGYTDPGLYFKIPVIQQVAYYEDRILPLRGEELEVTPIDDRRLVVDAFARWRITDPVRFRQAVGTELAALSRLESILNASLREVLGGVTSDTILSDERSELMTRIRDVARAQSQNIGVQIVDVRLRRVDLPQQNLQATYERMQAERQREAADERARGEEAALRIRANADRQAIELVSEARRESDIIRGTAEAERNRVFAQAFGRDEEFFAFYRSMKAYENALTGENSTMVITPDSEFFEYLSRGGLANTPGVPGGADGAASETSAPEAGEGRDAITPVEGAAAADDADLQPAIGD